MCENRRVGSTSRSSPAAAAAAIAGYEPSRSSRRRSCVRAAARLAFGRGFVMDCPPAADSIKEYPNLGRKGSPDARESSLAALLEELRDEARPAGLVAGADPGAVVTVEVLVEQDQVAPV